MLNRQTASCQIQFHISEKKKVECGVNTHPVFNGDAICMTYGWELQCLAHCSKLNCLGQLQRPSAHMSTDAVCSGAQLCELDSAIIQTNIMQTNKDSWNYKALHRARLRAQSSTRSELLPGDVTSRALYSGKHLQRKSLVSAAAQLCCTRLTAGSQNLPRSSRAAVSALHATYRAGAVLLPRWRLTSNSRCGSAWPPCASQLHASSQSGWPVGGVQCTTTEQTTPAAWCTLQAHLMMRSLCSWVSLRPRSVRPVFTLSFKLRHLSCMATLGCSG